MITKSEIGEAIHLLVTLADIIRELKRIPSGHLYALVMPKLSLAEYEKAISLLIGSKLVSKSGDELVWNNASPARTEGGVL